MPNNFGTRRKSHKVGKTVKAHSRKAGIMMNVVRKQITKTPNHSSSDPQTKRLNS